jgi:hypothetical protein
MIRSWLPVQKAIFIEPNIPNKYKKKLSTSLPSEELTYRSKIKTNVLHNKIPQ